MTRSCFTRVAGLAALCVTALGCASGPDRTFGPADWAIVLRVPGERITAISVSPDGALFMATDRALYRSIPDEGGSATKIADDTAEFYRQLSAPSRRVVYILSNGGTSPQGMIRRWRDGEGIRVLEMPRLQRWMTCGNDCGLYGIPWYALWARTEDDALVVGDFGAIARISGESVALEPNPLMNLAREPVTNEDQYKTRLSTVTGHGDVEYAGSWSALLRYRNGIWDTIPHPAMSIDQQRTGHCLVKALAVQGEGLLLGGYIGFPQPESPCLFRSSSTGVLRLDRSVRGLGQPWIDRGELQPDGSALFYPGAYARGAVAEVVDGSVGIYRFPTLRRFGGAAVLGSYLYAGGQVGDTAIVVRVRRQ